MNTHFPAYPHRIGLVAIDLDGTVVDEHLAIHPETEAFMRALVEKKQCRVVVATGRMTPSALQFAQRLGVCEPIIGYQGAMIRKLTPQHTFGPHALGEIIHHAPINMTVARPLLDYLVQQGVHVNVYVTHQETENEHLFVHQSNPYASTYHTLSGIAPTVVDNLQEKLTAPPTKMLLIGNDESGHDLELLMADLEERFPGALTLCKSRQNFCEVIAPGVSKWNALWHLAQQLDPNLKPENIMAIGDQENDRHMLTEAGLGVAMGNAPEAIKHSARWITGTVWQQGAKQAIEAALQLAL